jgi:hypothetical protein
VNQREADVATSFQRAIDRIIELRPELVLIGGDVFHTVRPSNQAIVHAFVQFARLRSALPDTPVVMVAGNHDSPRSSDIGSILRLFRELGLHVVDREAERLSLEPLGVSVLAVPDVPGVARPKFTTDPAARYNVLLVHGEVQGVLPPQAASSDRAALAIEPEELTAAPWDYVALGHYHVYQQVAPNAYYSGSIDYTSSNTWGELHEERRSSVPGKGIIERDLATGEHRFHALPVARDLLDLPAVSATGLTAADVDARIAEAVDRCAGGGGIDDRMVRLVIRDFPRHLARDLDHKRLREYKRRALHFQLDLHPPQSPRLETGSASPGKRPSLADYVREKLLARPIDADVDRKELVRVGLAYLDEAEVQLTAAGALADATDAFDPAGA